MDTAHTSRVVVIAYIDEFPWATLEPDGTLGGLDGEILRACLPSCVPRLHEIRLSEVEEALGSSQYDIVTCGLGWASNRASLAQPSVPLFQARLAVFVRKGNPLHISRMDDIQAGTFDVGTIGQGLEEYTIRPYSMDRTRTYSEQTAMWSDLERGVTEAAYFERIAGLAYLATHRDANFEIAEPFSFADAPAFATAFWFRRGEVELVHEFNSSLDHLKESGDLGRMLVRYGASAADVLPVGAEFG